jgi:hypothetical protein
MSFYATVASRIRYKDLAPFRAAVALLEQGGWLKEAGAAVVCRGQSAGRVAVTRSRTNRVLMGGSGPQWDSSGERSTHNLRPG